jgi:hypothetical protein
MLEQIYNDFTTKMLPQIQQGLEISKEYFMDLYGRYINYLIITDSLWLGVGIVILIISILLARFVIKNHKRIYAIDDDTGLILIFSSLGIIILILVGFIMTSSNLDNLIKDIYIPEVRIIEILKEK